MRNLMNKQILVIALMILSATAFYSQDGVTTDEVEVITDSVKVYGEDFDLSGGIMDPVILKGIVKDENRVSCKLKGEIVETCTKKGCWMTIKSADGNDMRVTFKDYGFFVPKSGQGGKIAIMNGIATMDVTSVDQLKHFAKDAGRSKEEIDAITEPEKSIVFEATGVKILQ